jgi:hypothetical protein
MSVANVGLPKFDPQFTDDQHTHLARLDETLSAIVGTSRTQSQVLPYNTYVPLELSRVPKGAGICVISGYVNTVLGSSVTSIDIQSGNGNGDVYVSNLFAYPYGDSKNKFAINGTVIFRNNKLTEFPLLARAITTGNTDVTVEEIIVKFLNFGIIPAVVPVAPVAPVAPAVAPPVKNPIFGISVPKK